MELHNKYILHQYDLLDHYEAGIILTGPEVKSCKLKTVHFKGSYCSFDNGALYIKNFYIAPYKPAQREQRGYDPYRPRRLLLRRQECAALEMRSKDRGATIVPVRLYTKHRLVKVDVALAKGLKKYDKREKIKKREDERRMRRAFDAF